MLQKIRERFPDFFCPAAAAEHHNSVRRTHLSVIEKELRILHRGLEHRPEILRHDIPVLQARINGYPFVSYVNPALCKILIFFLVNIDQDFHAVTIHDQLPPSDCTEI